MTKANRKQRRAAKKTTLTAKKKVPIVLQSEKKLVLHVGCGDEKHGSGLHKQFQNDEWQEVRLDIDPKVAPDFVADMTNMPQIKSNQFDAIWSSHNLEHVFAHQVEDALKEFIRVLKVDGFLYLATPDVQAVAEAIVEKGLETALYKSPSGPISALDILYGFRPSIKNGHTAMAHKTGFNQRTMANKLNLAGFLNIRVQREAYSLWAIGYKRASKTAENSKIELLGNEDVNDMMAKRDLLDKEPEIKWKGLI